VVVPVPRVVPARAVSVMLPMTSIPVSDSRKRCMIHIRQRQPAKNPKRYQEQQNPFHGPSDNLSFEKLFYSTSRGIGSL
jgi:hypothetical protein